MKFLFFLLNILGVQFFAVAQDTDSLMHLHTRLADQQLQAYNNRNIEAFLEPYSDSVKVYLFPNKLLYTGKEIMRREYGKMFKELPQLHCALLNRITIGNKVIDMELVRIRDGQMMNAVAIYTIRNGKIAEVLFID